MASKSPQKSPSSNPPEDLAEVERALSVLQGRHPEHERVRREDEAKTAQRKAELDAIARIETRRVRWRRAVFGIAACTVGVVAVVATLVFRNEVTRRARIEQVGAPYRSMGFTPLAASSRSEPSRLEANAPAGCLLVASSTDAAIRLTHAAGVVEGSGPMVTCLCEGGPVSVSSEVEPGEGLVLLHIDSKILGGSRAFSFLPFEPATTAASDQACAEASFDAWLDTKGWTHASPVAKTGPVLRVDRAEGERWFADAARAPLREAGFEVRARVTPPAPFTVVEMPAESCALLLAETPSDRLSLRLKGGVSAVSPTAGNVGWCTSEESLVVAEREGTGDVTVLVAPAPRLGGLFGLREAARNAGTPVSYAMVASDDRAWDAKQQLLASAIPEALVSVSNVPELAADTEARIVALSMESPGTLVPETPPDVFSFCEPSLEGAENVVCVFSGPQKWRTKSLDVSAGLARAKLPFWLFGLQGVGEPAAMKVAAQVIELARRLRHDGFEPTTIDGVTELDKGAEILGRADEDAVVALALAPIDPWVFPYTDGPAWTLEGEPRVVPIEPLKRITVTASTKTLAKKESRRTVVFRRQKR